jgi:two-component system, cell cycle sensor histidine kinase and response regulator CckA
MKPECIPKESAVEAAAVTGAASCRTAQSILEAFAHRTAADLLHKREKDWLAKGEERYHSFVSRSEDGMWCVEFDRPIPTDLPPKEQLALVYRHSYYSECNDAAAKLLGPVDRGEVVGRHTVDVSSKRAVRKAFLELVHSAYRFATCETEQFLPDGCHFVLLSQLGIVKDGMLRRVWGVTRDITEFKQIQGALDASKEHMTNLLKSVHLFVIALDPSGAIEACNNYFSELTGWLCDDVKGKNWFELMVAPEERADLQEKFAAQLASPGRPMHFESTLLGPSGGRWQVAWDSTALGDERLEVKVIANIGRDITQEKAVEASLRQLQKVESIGKLAGGIAHDFNNLLAVIGGYASHLMDRHTPGDPEYTELGEIRNAVGTGAQLTQQLLTFTRRRACNPEALNLNGIVERDCAMLRRTLGKNIDMVTSLDPSLGLVKVDPVEISQILLNLAVNARDAMPSGGKLTIASSNATISDGQGSVVPAVPAGQYVQLTVADTGIGMTKEVLDRLFEPFFTTKEAGKGTGLGLSIIFGIVKQSGGHIKVESEAGRGTSFRVFLPRAQPEATSASVSENRRTANQGGDETILLVDDRQDVLTLAATILRGLGYKLLEASDPSQALHVAESESRIDLMLSDLVLPEMQGPELAERMRSLRPEIEIAFMSGCPDPKIKVPFLQKPFTPDSLAKTVREVLDRRLPFR